MYHASCQQGSAYCPPCRTVFGTVLTIPTLFVEILLKTRLSPLHYTQRNEYDVNNDIKHIEIYEKKEDQTMNAPVSVDRAKTIIQAWYKEYCEDYGKMIVPLEIEKEHDQVDRAYKVTHPLNNKSTHIYWSTLGEYEKSGSIGIPGDLKTGIWDCFVDLG